MEEDKKPKASRSHSNKVNCYTTPHIKKKIKKYQEQNGRQSESSVVNTALDYFFKNHTV